MIVWRLIYGLLICWISGKNFERRESTLRSSWFTRIMRTGAYCRPISPTARPNGDPVARQKKRSPWWKYWTIRSCSCCSLTNTIISPIQSCFRCPEVSISIAFPHCISWQCDPVYLRNSAQQREHHRPREEDRMGHDAAIGIASEGEVRFQCDLQRFPSRANHRLHWEEGGIHVTSTYSIRNLINHLCIRILWGSFLRMSWKRQGLMINWKDVFNRSSTIAG